MFFSVFFRRGLHFNVVPKISFFGWLGALKKKSVHLEPFLSLCLFSIHTFFVLLLRRLWRCFVGLKFSIFSQVSFVCGRYAVDLVKRGASEKKGVLLRTVLMACAGDEGC